MGWDSRHQVDIGTLEATGDLQSRRAPNKGAAFEQPDALVQRKPLVVEQGFSIYRLASYLQARGIRVRVVKPRHIVGFAKSHNRRHQTDSAAAV